MKREDALVEKLNELIVAHDRLGVKVTGLTDVHNQMADEFNALRVLLIRKGIVTMEEMNKVSAEVSAKVDQVMAKKKDGEEPEDFSV